MKYRNYLVNLANAFRYRFEQIATHFNFDNGDEFEIALCYVLREILPQQYGICRGFVVSAGDQAAGDDIIIYDRFRFPTLRLFPQETYDRKQDIPIEAVYAYIEAKYTLHLYGDMRDGQSLLKASSQVSAVKSIPRAPRTSEFLHPYFRSNTSYSHRPDWPPELNPIYGAVFALRVKDKKDGRFLTSGSATSSLQTSPVQIPIPPPDLIIAGDSDLLVPCVDDPQGPIVHSPFFIQNISSLRPSQSREIAFATGVSLLLYALDTIQLGRMPWEVIINDGLGRT